MCDPQSLDVSIERVDGAASTRARDHVAVEEPLEIQLVHGAKDASGRRAVKPVAVTMRTPGEDVELAVGFLLAEGIVRSWEDVERAEHWGKDTGELRLQNVVRVELKPHVAVDLRRLERHFYMTSSCGVCGKTSVEAIRTTCGAGLRDGFVVQSQVIHALPEVLRQAQAVFDRTGGLHAAALFDGGGKLVALREDVGRHNAVDKLVGSQLMTGAATSERVMLVSGRASFELMQKTVMAGIPIMAAVGAPSSLAVELAEQFNVTLLGFVRNHRFNIYSAPQRIQGAKKPAEA